MEKYRIWATLHPFFESGDIMGRSVANEGFIRAFIAASPYDRHDFFLSDEGLAARVQERLAQDFPDKDKAGFFRVTTRYALPETLAATDIEVFHLSDCVADAVPLFRLRNALSRNIFSVTGPTHSLSYARYGAYFFDQIWEGVTQRDAIIATSRAGEGAVSSMFSALRRGYGLERVPSPQIVRIPLGVTPDDFIPPKDKGGASIAIRQELGIPEDHLVLLVFARISHYSKMDVLPLFRALLRAEECGLPRGGYTVLLSGWMDVGDTAAAYADIAARCGIRFLLVPSPDDAMRRKLFAGADIFLSPVDNPQETFGLTLLEAGAASLPVVASDFDGYRDLIVHGETGFLIPTYGPAATPETDALSGVWFDNQRHLQIAQQSVVSVPDMARAIGLLAGDADLRARFGAAARKRILDHYTWPHIVARYIALWEELAAIPVTRPVAAHPLHLGYTEIFGGYYATLFDPKIAQTTRVQWTAFGEAVYRGKDFPAVYGGIERLIALDSLRKILFNARNPVPLATLLPGAMDTPFAEQKAFPVLWALKQDLLEIVRDAS